MITLNDRIGTLLDNPIGHDMFSRIAQYAGINVSFLDAPLIKNIKISALPKLSGGQLDAKLLDTLLELCNQEADEPRPAPSSDRAWWKEAVIYQIYPMSFKDGNGDGVGDIPGIIEKLDYLQDLGVTALWLSPIYDSPNDDNGYDVRDYQKIQAEYGTMEDFDRLVSQLHGRGMRLIMDMVLNHTSDEHPWFVESQKSKDNPYSDFYIWQDARDGGEPNNWQSFFSGPAWKFFPSRKQYAMHLFSSKQMDLNWDNPKVRQEVMKIMRFWRGKGVDGFRLDVISVISKTSMDDGSDAIGGLMGMRGIEHYFYGKHLHEYLRQLRSEGLEDAFAIGETPGTGVRMSQMLTAPERGELDTVFCFDHIDNPGRHKYDDYCYDLNHTKKCFIEYETSFADVAWPTIFFENHDNPRMVSKVDPQLKHRDAVAKLLCVLTMTARGTAFVYQGQELGAANVEFQDISQVRDVEALNRYKELRSENCSDQEAFDRLLPGLRDHARTPMQWDNGEYAGFSQHEPWIRVGDKDVCSAARQQADETSVLAFYKKLIALRLSHIDTLVYGAFRAVHEKKADFFGYWRTGESGAYYVEANLSAQPMQPPKRDKKLKLLLSSGAGEGEILQPYEARIYKM